MEAPSLGRGGEHSSPVIFPTEASPAHRFQQGGPSQGTLLPAKTRALAAPPAELGAGVLPLFPTLPGDVLYPGVSLSQTRGP
ncbi:hypothetical protein VUR80DRAFT_6555 [Thermomyces stellatus]